MWARSPSGGLCCHPQVTVSAPSWVIACGWHSGQLLSAEGAPQLAEVERGKLRLFCCHLQVQRPETGGQRLNALLMSTWECRRNASAPNVQRFKSQAPRMVFRSGAFAG